MASYALIKNGKVDNVASIEPDDLPKLKLDADTVVNIEGLQVGIGYLYDAGEFTRPPVVAPKPAVKTLEEQVAELTAKVAALEGGK